VKLRYGLVNRTLLWKASCFAYIFVSIVVNLLLTLMCH